MGLSHGPRATQARQHGRNRQAGSSWCDHTPAVWSRASPLTSLRISSIPWEMKTTICFMVKMKQDSSRHIVGNFPSWYKEELTAGSARILCTEITQHGSWHKVGAHQHLRVSCLVDWVPLRKSLKGFKQRKNMMGFKILRTSLYLLWGEEGRGTGMGVGSPLCCPPPGQRPHGQEVRIQWKNRVLSKWKGWRLGRSELRFLMRCFFWWCQDAGRKQGRVG